MDEDLIYENVNETCSPTPSLKSASLKVVRPNTTKEERTPPYGQESPGEKTPDFLKSKRLLSPVTSVGLTVRYANAETEFGDAYEDPVSVREKRVSVSPSVKSDMYLAVMEEDKEQVYDNPVANSDVDDMDFDHEKRFSLAELKRGSNDSASNLVPDEHDYSPAPLKKVMFHKDQSRAFQERNKDAAPKQETKSAMENLVYYVKDHYAIIFRILTVVTFLISILAFMIVLIAVVAIFPSKCKCPVLNQDGNSSDKLNSYIRATVQSIRLTCPSSWIEYRNNCYSPIIDEVKGFAAAAKSCKTFGANLPAIKSAEENIFIRENVVKPSISDGDVLLIGLTSEKHDPWDASYAWENGAKVTFINNLSNLSLPMTRRCYAIIPSGNWTTTDCVRNNMYFCERKVLKIFSP